MIEQLRLLVKLQAVDKSAYEVEQELIQIPDRFSEMEESQRIVTSELNLAKEELEQASKIRADLEARAEELKNRQRKAENRLMGAKTQKEYQAANAEIDEAKDSLKETEDLLIEAMERFETLDARANEIQGQLDSLIASDSQVRAELEERQKTLTKEIDVLNKQRQGMLEGIEAQLMGEYDFIRQRRQGVAVAPVSNGSCGCCHMNLPPQQYNELQRMDKVMYCPSCRRLVYWADADEFSDL